MGELMNPRKNAFFSFCKTPFYKCVLRAWTPPRPHPFLVLIPHQQVPLLLQPHQDGGGALSVVKVRLPPALVRAGAAAEADAMGATPQEVVRREGAHLDQEDV